MSFWDKVGKAAASAGKAVGKMAVDAGKAAVDNAKDGLEKSRQFEAEYADTPSYELFTILAVATSDKQYAKCLAVRKILLSRGESQEAIDAAARELRYK